jgi:hypothetical protein
MSTEWGEMCTKCYFCKKVNEIERLEGLGVALRILLKQVFDKRKDRL